MNIRKATKGDLPRILEIYRLAREYMAATGNPNQWGKNQWPPQYLVVQDIAEGKSYVCEETKRVLGVFYFDQGKDVDENYRQIFKGEWLDDSPYGVIHRIAVDNDVKGVGTFCVEWALTQNEHLRLDTHPDNKIMQAFAEKLGFQRCGIIYVKQDCDPRIAFERIPQ